MSKKHILAIAGVVLVYWLVAHVFVSDETRIRRLIDGCVDGFNDTHKARCIAGLADDYRDRTAGFSRDQLGQLLVYLFLKEKHPDMGEFRYRVELVPDGVEIEVVDESPKTAKATVLARFSQLVGEDFEPVWDVEVKGDLEKTSDGWKVKRSRFRDVKGRSPF